MQTILSLTLDDAMPMIATAQQAARDQGRAVSIAIVDQSGELVGFARMPGARAYTIDLALRKARAAASVGVSTAILQARSADYNAGQGGLPVIIDGQICGAIGVSGALPEQDEAIGSAAIFALTGATART